MVMHLLFFCYGCFSCCIVYVIAREGVQFGINFTSCSENGNEIGRGCYFAIIATTSAIASFVKDKISDFQTHFHNE